jgi:phage terminase large subunit-like protein
VLSSDGRLSQGVNPSAALVDEWWLFQHQRERETYNALAKALHKRSGQSWLLAITTAGWDRQSQLGETYEKALAHPKLEVRKDGLLLCLRDTKSGFLMHWYGPPEGAEELDIENPAVIRACNPASWVRPGDLIAELNRPDTDEYDWRRLHLNAWTRTRAAWLPSGCWAGLRSDAEIPERGEIYVGVDVGLFHDSTAVCWAHLMEDGRLCLRVRVFSAREDAPAHVFVGGGKVRLEQVEEFIRELAQRYRVREVAYDPRYFARSAEILESAGLTLVEFLQASGPMADAYQGFYQEALEGRLAHDGDPVFAAHVEAAAAQKSERGWKVYKLKSSQRIDALVAAVLAVARARVNKKSLAPGIFWMEW